MLPSITNEVLKQVVAEFDAGELITMREQVLFLTNRTPELTGTFTSTPMMGLLLSLEISDHITSCFRSAPGQIKSL